MTRSPRRTGSTRWTAAGVAATAMALLPAAARAQEPSGGNDRYLRVVEVPGKSIALEVAARAFDPAGGAGPKVTLVSVSHIGERGLYRRIQELLAAHDVVLYESVMPAGAGGAGGATDVERIESTRAAMGFIASIGARHMQAAGSHPVDLRELGAFAEGIDPRLADWLDVASRDAWGRRLVYQAHAGGSRFWLASLGADGRPGGLGADADIQIDEATEVDSLDEEGGNVQSALAEALGLEFQLDALDYSGARFRPADMAMDQVERALRGEGIEFAPLAEGLAGTTLPARLVVVMLHLMRALDSFFEGAIADSMKVVLIELLGDEAVLDAALAQVGPGLEKVLIDMRNQIVIERIAAVRAGEPQVGSIAVLYGAGHMQDMAERLSTLGYTPGATQWLTAIEVDLSKSAVSPRDLKMLRRTVRRALDTGAARPGR